MIRAHALAVRYLPVRLRRRLLRFLDALGPLPARIKAGPAQGLIVLAPFSRARVYRTAGYESHILNTLSSVLQPGMVACDVGSFLGYHALAMAQLVGPSGCVYAFEPLPRHLKTLTRSLRRNHLSHVQPLAVAVGDVTGTVQLSECVNDSMNSVFQGEPPAGSVRRMTVPITTLDDWAAENDLDRLDCIKFDIEGQELAALQGSIGVIDRFQPSIIIEIHRGVHVPYQPWAIIEWLQSVGYGTELIANETTSNLQFVAAIDRLQKVVPGPGAMRILHVLARPNSAPSNETLTTDI